MSTPARAWRLNHALRDAQKVCALTNVGTVLKSIKCDIFQLNASSVEYSTDPVEYTTEVRQLI